MAFGDTVIRRVPQEAALGSLVDVSALKPRPGQLGMLYWSEESHVTMRLEAVDRGALPEFPYDTTTSQDFCSLAFAQGMNVGEHAALVLRVKMVEQKWTGTRGEVYLVVFGVDIDGATVTYLRLWRFGEDDLAAGTTCIIRGLKVVLESQWDESQSRYVPRLEGPKTFECTNRVSIEDVSHVPAITAFFS